MKTLITLAIATIWLVFLIVAGIVGSGAILFDELWRRGRRGFMFALVLGAFLFSGCASWTPAQNSAVLSDSFTIARIAAVAASQYYGGAQGAQLASVGLDAIGAVAQSYVGYRMPGTVIASSPGVDGVGSALVGVIAPNHVVSQSDVTTINKAAEIAKTLSAAQLQSVPSK